MKKLRSFLFITIFTIGIQSFLNFVQAENKIPTSKEYIENYVAENYIGITNKQMMEDYEYVWKELKKIILILVLQKEWELTQIRFIKSIKKKYKIVKMILNIII